MTTHTSSQTETAPPHAAQFIVTVYGDIAEPRGGELWMGSLIELCAAVGINESLVRTAVSRLVSAGQITGKRKGRRSYYRLTPEAQQSFAAASSVIFGREPSDENWVVAYVQRPDDLANYLRTGFAKLGPDHVIAPAHKAEIVSAGLSFSMAPIIGDKGLRHWASTLWEIEPHVDAYHGFLASLRHRNLSSKSDFQRLIARLLLVHDFRMIVLKDPGLPALALPENWPGTHARRAFAQSYLELSPAANLAIAAKLSDQSGPLSSSTQAVVQREKGLAR